jgi:hypothetical protein
MVKCGHSLSFLVIHRNSIILAFRYNSIFKLPNFQINSQQGLKRQPGEAGLDVFAGRRRLTQEDPARSFKTQAQRAR